MRNGADTFIKSYLNLFALFITLNISKLLIFDPGKSWKTIHEIVNVHTKIAIRLSKILSPIVYCYAGVFQRFCSVTSTHLWICLILISRTNSQMNWYIIININLFLTKLKTNWILNCAHEDKRILRFTKNLKFVGTHNIPTTYILILNEVSNHILLLSKFI